jgi:hypothetical protein
VQGTEFHLKAISPSASPTHLKVTTRPLDPHIIQAYSGQAVRLQHPIRSKLQHTRQETDTQSNNGVQILGYIENRPRNLRDWTSLTLGASVSPPQQQSESSTAFPMPEPLLSSDRIIIAVPTVQHTCLRGPNNYQFPCKYWPRQFDLPTNYYHSIE